MIKQVPINKHLTTFLKYYINARMIKPQESKYKVIHTLSFVFIIKLNKSTRKIGIININRTGNVTYNVILRCGLIFASSTLFRRSCHSILSSHAFCCCSQFLHILQYVTTVTGEFEYLTVYKSTLRSRTFLG